MKTAKSPRLTYVFLYRREDMLNLSTVPCVRSSAMYLQKDIVQSEAFTKQQRISSYNYFLPSAFLGYPIACR